MRLLNLFEKDCSCRKDYVSPAVGVVAFDSSRPFATSFIVPIETDVCVEEWGTSTGNDVSFE